MADATFVSGEYETVQYTPTAGDVAIGQVVLIGTVTSNTGGAGALAGVAHQAILNNVQGTLAIGGAIYSVVNLNNAANGAKMYWDDTNNKVTSVSTNNATFGFIVKSGAGGANTACQVLHKPYYGGA